MQLEPNSVSTCRSQYVCFLVYARNWHQTAIKYSEGDSKMMAMQSSQRGKKLFHCMANAIVYKQKAEEVQGAHNKQSENQYNKTSKPHGLHLLHHRDMLQSI